MIKIEIVANERFFSANILYARPEASVEEVMRAAAMAEIHDQVRIVTGNNIQSTFQ